MEQMKGIDNMKNKLAMFSLMLVGDILRKPLILLTTLAKISCKVSGHGVIPDPFRNLRRSKKEQLKGIDALKK